MNIKYRTRPKTVIEKTKIILIIVIIYYMIYLLSGTIVGYTNSPYSLKIQEIIKNLFFISGIVILLEYIRSIVLKKYNNIIVVVLITTIFIFLKIDIGNIKNIINTEEIIKIMLGEFLPICAESILLTYLSITGGYLLNFAYTIPTILTKILFPIFPDLDWFILASSKYILYAMIFLFLRYEDSMQSRNIIKRKEKESNPILTIPFIIFIIIIACFVAGIFSYKPIAVISNSMIPTFYKGDMCIVKKIEDYNQIKDIKKGDIIEYSLNDIFVVHRVINIEKHENGYRFLTKGDNNKTVDLLLVNEDQVIGKVIYVVKYIGYPSVWFHEFLMKNFK